MADSLEESLYLPLDFRRCVFDGESSLRPNPRRRLRQTPSRLAAT
jgi:hypothetical protein